MDIDSSPPNDPLWTDMWYLHGANGKKNYHNIQVLLFTYLLHICK